MDIKNIFKEIKKKGFYLTPQRKRIIEIILKLKEHSTAFDIYSKVKEKDKNVGFATVYRTIKILKEIGIIKEREFGEKMRKYEIEKEHHDHLVCKKCGKVIEFSSKKLEKIQEEIAKKYGFILTEHKHELYGICKNCSKT